MTISTNPTIERANDNCSGAPVPRRKVAHRRRRAWLACLGAALLVSCSHDQSEVVVPGSDKAAPTEVRMTWLGLSGWGFKIGGLNIVMNGYITRIPREHFDGTGTLAYTSAPWPIDKSAVDKMNGVLAEAPGSPVNLLITGHSHFDHSFDTPYWARRTDAKIIGPRSTCYQARALDIPAERCMEVYGGETLRLNKYVTMRVVRWNHSGSRDLNPVQHDPIELQAVPSADANGNLRAGMAEDFPNGGGSRGYLFTVTTADRETLSFFVTDSGAPQDLASDSIVDGINFRSPTEGLARAMADARLKAVDAWLGTGGKPVAALAFAQLKPKAYLPNYLGSAFEPFAKGNTDPFRDSALATYLAANKVALVPPLQYLDALVLDSNGVRPVDNTAMKKAYGF